MVHAYRAERVSLSADLPVRSTAALRWWVRLCRQAMPNMARDAHGPPGKEGAKLSRFRQETATVRRTLTVHEEAIRQLALSNNARCTESVVFSWPPASGSLRRHKGCRSHARGISFRLELKQTSIYDGSGRDEMHATKEGVH